MLLVLWEFEGTFLTFSKTDLLISLWLPELPNGKIPTGNPTAQIPWFPISEQR
jgi:hypothetical protein